MATLPRRLLLSLLVTLTALSCADTGRAPTTPSAVQLPTPEMSWECGRQAQIAAAQASGWSFPAPTASCPAVVVPQEVGAGQVSVAPGNLRSTITNTTTVRLDWNTVPEVVTSFQVEAGSAPTLANLAVLNTGSSATSLTVNSVPFGTYYVRVRGVGPDGIPGPPSNEIVVRVPDGACSLPGAPRNLTRLVTGNQVSLSWLAPDGGDPPSTYNVEAGSGAGLSDIIVFNTGTAATALLATAPDGLYFVRLRGMNACGAGAASNEVAVGVNRPEPPIVSPPTPPTPPPAPPPPPDTGGGGGGGGGGTTPPPCTYTVSPPSVSFGSGANTFDVTVTTVAGCAWSASASGFVSVNTAGPGTGPGTARFDVSVNPGGARTGTARISYAGTGTDVSVAQAAAPSGPPVEGLVSGVSEVSVPLAEPPTVVRGSRPDAGAGPIVGASASAGTAPGTTRVTVSSTGGTFDTVIVSADTAVSTSTSLRPMVVTEAFYLIRLAAPTTSVQLTLTTPGGPNFSGQFGARLGSGPVGNYAQVTVAPPTVCGYELSPLEPSALPISGGPFVVNVITSPGCTWSVAPVSSPFVSGGGKGSGPGTATVNFAANTGPARTGIVRVSFQIAPSGANLFVPQLGPVSGTSNAVNIALTWNTSADMDLHVIEPDGRHVFWNDFRGTTARLDANDFTGPGPENTFVPAGAALSGNYQVYIVHRSGSAPTLSTITITFDGSPTKFSFTRTTTAASATTGINVANVNVISRTATEVTGTRTADTTDRPR